MKKNIILAPMAGITDLGFRLFNRAFGCELGFVEMINVRSLGYNSKKTREMLKSQPGDSPLGVQLLGSDKSYILRSLDILSSYKFDIVDFNAACPAKKVVKRGEGAALMQDPAKLGKLVRVLVENLSIPVTVKIRSGWDGSSVNAPEVALAAQEAGASAVFIHGRTKQQEYSGEVDYRTIKKVKEALSIPVIASGNIFSGPLAACMLEKTGCNGLLVARGCLGNPWIFAELENYLGKGIIPPRPGLPELTEAMKKQLELCIKHEGEQMAVILFRKFFAWYTKGYKRVRPLREQASRAKNKKEMLELISRFEEAAGPRREVVL